MRLGVQTVIRKRPGVAVDSYGNEVPDWGSTTDLSIPGCNVQPGGGSEVDDTREATTTLYSIWAPADADVVETDRINHEGVDYAVDGAIERWNSSPRMPYKMIRLKAVAG